MHKSFVSTFDVAMRIIAAAVLRIPDNMILQLVDITHKQYIGFLRCLSDSCPPGSGDEVMVKLCYEAYGKPWVSWENHLMAEKEVVIQLLTEGNEIWGNQTGITPQQIADSIYADEMKKQLPMQQTPKSRSDLH